MGRTFRYGGVPGFIADYQSTMRLPGRQIDFTQVPDNFRTTAVVLTVATGGAALNATTITLAAPLTQGIPANTTLNFGVGKLANVNTAALKGAATLTVDPLGAALLAGNTATYAGFDGGYGYVGHKLIASGTIIAELSTGLIIPRSLVTDGTAASGILIDTAQEFNLTDAANGYGILAGGAVYADLLPESQNANFATWKTELTNTVPGFRFVKYVDSRTGEGVRY